MSLTFDSASADPQSPDTQQEYPDSWYAATAHPAPARPALEGDVDADICIIGAGYSGLATGIHLAEQGHRVRILEAARIGWGASGRNGGQLVNGYSRGLDVIERRYGPDAARMLGSMAFEGSSIIRDIVQRFDIDCDLRDGGVFAARNQRQVRELQAQKDSWESYGNDALELLDENGIRAHVNSELYVGGLLDRRGGHVHPLNLALGEAAAIERLGGIIHENSEVIRLEHGAEPVVHTRAGRVRAGHTVICGNAYLGDTVPALRDRVMPVSTQMIATERLPEAQIRALLPAGTCIEDCNYVLDYYRATADNRILFGGGIIYGGATPANIIDRLRPHLIRTFPELADVRTDHAWSGNFALTLTRIPHMGRLDDNIWFTHGYSGHGVTTTHLAGKLIAEAIAGNTQRFAAFAGLRNYPFPGGRVLRVPLTALGAWYYQLRDRIGI